MRTKQEQQSPSKAGSRRRGSGAGKQTLPILDTPSIAEIPQDDGAAHDAHKSRFARWRAATLALVYVLMAAHVTHWLIAGRTLAPLELNEVVYTVELGIVTAGFLFMLVAVLATSILGRFFCSWGCHILALQDLCAWLLGKVGIRPKAVRSRTLMLAPFVVAAYMFAWPAIERAMTGTAFPTLHTTTDAQGWASFMTENFWRNLPGPGIALLTFFVCGFLVVYVLGSRSFCTYGCPYGAVFRVADKISPGRIRLVKSCGDCGLCTSVCTSHVRVGEELQRYGMVVDSACLKDLDCVSVCPEDAVRFGFGRPGWMNKVRDDVPVRRRYDFTPWEEGMLVILLLAGVFIYRGLYGRVPFFLSISFGIILGYMTVVAGRMATRPTARFNRWMLKVEGRTRPAGVLFAAVFLVAVAASIHSGWICYHAWQGMREVHALGRNIDGDASVHLESFAPQIASALSHVETVDRWGLFTTPAVIAPLGKLHCAAASIEISKGRASPAIRHLREALRLDAANAHVHLELGSLLLEQGAISEGLAHLRRAVVLAPDSADAHYNLGVGLAMTGKSAEAEREISQAATLNPNDPQIAAFQQHLVRTSAADPQAAP
ncbi:MAG: tetratricopeptide repeat protein [Phycisphaerales bacterium]|nr:tetratricopeptide repeat protein [Phycisphaerales bacterium]